MNEILPYREKPLSADAFAKLVTITKKHFTFERKMIGKRIPKYENDGTIYGWEHDLVPDGYNFTEIETPPPALMEAIMRPATPAAIKEHLFILSRMKRYTGGDSGLFIIAREIYRHLPDCSEFALMKVCDDFALDRSTKFFPDPADFIAEVKKLQSAIFGMKKPEARKKSESESTPRPTEKQKRRVRRMLKLATKTAESWTSWERKFYEFYKKN